MTPEEWRRAKELFHEALDLPAGRREAFLKEAGVEPSVVSEVRRLLDQQGSASGFLETPAAAFSPDLLDGRAAAAERSDQPQTVGPYRVLGLLGEGGMGVVYRAEQESPKRTVALKVIRPGLASESMLRRFEHEAQALARLQHPGIAQVYHAGTEGNGAHRRPYFAMELVEGLPLLRFAETRGLGARDRIALFARVCDAVQHAHMKGVIHRDLKPGNIVVDDSGQPKVLDFGIARVTDSDVRAATVQTDVGQIVGTVPYMSPEQIAGDPADLDTRSDVYSLGVVLFELLTGRLPYDVERKSIIEAARLIREQAPSRLSTAARGLRGDLDIIVGKALEKDKHRRYQSAADLGADLTRYLDNEPIAARPPSAAYQISKFAARHKGLVAAVVSIIFILSGALGGVFWQRNIARREASDAKTQKGIAEKEAAEAEVQRKAASEHATEAETQRKAASREAARATAINEFFMDMLKEANPERRHGNEMSVKEMLDAAAVKLAEKPTGDVEIDEEIRGTLGQTYWQLGALDKAEPLLKAAAERAEAALGSDHELVHESLNQRALVLIQLGRSEEAGPLLERVYTARVRKLGEPDPATLSVMNNWARWLDANGRPDEGLALMERAARLRAERLGPDDRKTLISFDNMGKVLLNHGRLDEALKWMKIANEGFVRTVTEKDPDTLASYQNLAELMRKRKEFGEAERYARLAADGRRVVLGMSDRFTLYSIITLGRTLMEQDRPVEAELPLREAFEGIRVVGRPGEVLLAGWGVAYARCLIALKKFAEAETVLRECETNAAAGTGNTAPSKRNVAEAHVALYTAWNRPDEAAAWQDKLPGK